MLSLRGECWLVVVLACRYISDVYGTGDSSLSVTCSWHVEVVHAGSLQTPLKQFQNIQGLMDITSVIDQTDVNNLYNLHVHQNGFYSYPHVLQVKLLCTDFEGAARSYLLSGGQPVVTLAYNGIAVDQMTRRHRLETFGGLVVDSGHMNGTCKKDFCEPMWMVPLPLDGSTGLITVTVDSLGIGLFAPAKASYTLTLTGYVDETGQYIAELGSPVSGIGSVHQQNPRPLIHIPLYSPSLILPLHDSGNVLTYVISSDSFTTFTQLQAPVIDRSGGEVCNCVLPDHSRFSVVSLPEQLLFVTKFGITQLVGNLSQAENVPDHVLAPRAVYAACVREVMVTSQSIVYDHWTLLALGGCSDEGTVYSSDLTTNNGSNLILSPVVDSEGRGLCDAAGVSPSHCSIVTGAVSSTPISVLLFLVLDTSTHPGTYSLWMFEGDNWMKVWQRHRYLPTVAPTDPYPLHSEDSAESETDTTLLTLSVVEVTQHVSNHIFMAGNRLLTSPDKGANVYLVPSFDGNSAIVLMVFSRGSLYTFLTDTQQLWVGMVGSLDVVRVYPTPDWDIVHHRHSSLHPFTIITMFFTDNQQLQLLVLDESDTLVRLPVYLQRVLQHLTATTPWIFNTNLTSGADLREVIEPGNRCPFVDIRFELPTLDWFTKEEDIMFEPPMTSLESGLHSELSMSVYQAMVLSTEMSRTQYTDRQYITPYTNHLDMWREQISENKVFHKYLFQNNHTISHLMVDGSGQRKVLYDDGMLKRDLPHVIYLNHRQNFTFLVHIQLTDGELSKLRSPGTEEDVRLGVVVSSNDHLTAQTQRTYCPLNNTVIYKVTLVERGRLGQVRPPGVALKAVSVHISVHNAPLQCFSNSMGVAGNPITELQGMYQMTVMLGCSPTQRIYFDHFAAKNNIIKTKEDTFDCLYPDPELPCFYFYNGFYPEFQVQDLATGEHHVWEGNYTLKVIGGGEGGVENIRRFTQEEVIEYNNLNTTKASLIVGPMDDVLSRDGWLLYNRQQNGMSWFCQPQSPCSLIKPQMPNNSEYFFLLEFSNREVDLDSNCELVLEFIVHVHGLPINAMSFSIMLVLVAVSIICVWFGLFYAFTRNNGALRKTIQNYLKRSKVKPEDAILAMKDLNPEDLEHLAQKDWRAVLQHRMRGEVGTKTTVTAKGSDDAICAQTALGDDHRSDNVSVGADSGRGHARMSRRRTSVGMSSALEGRHSVMTTLTDQELEELRNTNRNSRKDTVRRLSLVQEL